MGHNKQGTEIGAASSIACSQKFKKQNDLFGKLFNSEEPQSLKGQNIDYEKDLNWINFSQLSIIVKGGQSLINNNGARQRENSAANINIIGKNSSSKQVFQIQNQRHTSTKQTQLNCQKHTITLNTPQLSIWNNRLLIIRERLSNQQYKSIRDDGVRQFPGTDMSHEERDSMHFLNELGLSHKWNRLTMKWINVAFWEAKFSQSTIMTPMQNEKVINYQAGYQANPVSIPIESHGHQDSQYQYRGTDQQKRLQQKCQVDQTITPSAAMLDLSGIAQSTGISVELHPYKLPQAHLFQNDDFFPKPERCNSAIKDYHLQIDFDTLQYDDSGLVSPQDLQIADLEMIREIFSEACLIAHPKLSSRFNFERRIGSGSQATVDQYILKTKQQAHGSNDLENQQNISYAMKTYRINSEKEDQTCPEELILNEISFLRSLKACQNIVQLDSVYIEHSPDSSEKSLILVMRLAPQGSLYKYLSKKRQFSEDEVRTILAQLLLALDLMHRKGIIHRDIKTDNILLIDKKDLSVCITDLGMACLVTDEEELQMKCGSPGFVAPEILKNQMGSTKSDIFSLGAIFYRLLMGTSLFRGANAKEVLSNNKYQIPSQLIDANVKGFSKECIDLMKKMLIIDPLKRFSAEDCLMHDWFIKDREALESSLLINKNQNILNTILRNTPSILDREGSKEFDSFVITPNYYALLEQISNIDGSVQLHAPLQKSPKHRYHSPAYSNIQLNSLINRKSGIQLQCTPKVAHRMQSSNGNFHKQIQFGGVIRNQELDSSKSPKKGASIMQRSESAGSLRLQFCYNRILHHQRNLKSQSKFAGAKAQLQGIGGTIKHLLKKNSFSQRNILGGTPHSQIGHTGMEFGQQVSQALKNQQANREKEEAQKYALNITKINNHQLQMQSQDVFKDRSTNKVKLVREAAADSEIQLDQQSDKPIIKGKIDTGKASLGLKKQPIIKVEDEDQSIDADEFKDVDIGFDAEEYTVQFEFKVENQTGQQLQNEMLPKIITAQKKEIISSVLQSSAIESKVLQRTQIGQLVEREDRWMSKKNPHKYKLID